MLRLFIATLVTLAALMAPSAASAQDPDVFCGPDEVAYYRCGAILVILKEDTADTIEDVIERMGGDSATDILQQFLSVRDALDPDGVVEDTSEAAIYQVAVPVGQEHAMADAYRADPAVYGAAVDRETIGSTTPPNTAIPYRGDAAWLAIVGAGLLVAAALVVGSSTDRRVDRRL